MSSNPWLKKNPFMSAWLSAAHSMAGPARAQATAQARRTAATVASQASLEWLKLWTGTPTRAGSKRRRSRP